MLRRAAHLAARPQVSAATLPGIDDHFWDWMLWLAAKQQAGKAGLIAAEQAVSPALR